MRALSIRQPYAEMILLGLKPGDYRKQRTHIINERFWLYSPKQWARPAAMEGGIWSRDLVAAKPPPWIVELATAMKLFGDKELPTGVIVGSAMIDLCIAGEGFFQWRFADVERAKKLIKPTRPPQPVWFEPF